MGDRVNWDHLFDAAAYVRRTRERARAHQPRTAAEWTAYLQAWHAFALRKARRHAAETGFTWTDAEEAAWQAALPDHVAAVMRFYGSRDADVRSPGDPDDAHAGQPRQDSHD